MIMNSNLPVSREFASALDLQRKIVLYMVIICGNLISGPDLVSTEFRRDMMQAEYAD